MTAAPAQTHRPGSSLQGPRKDAIDSLQKRIDFFIGEANRLRYAQNSHVVISRLPAELLSDVFLYVVESGLLDDDTCFSPGTFNFLQVCRRWHEVAVAFPRLWVWWVAGAGKLWHVFNARSKGAPLFLTWQPGLLGSAQDTFTTAEIPRRIRRLNFCGSRAELERLLGALDPSSTSITSSIQMDTYWGNNGEHLTRFLSLPFPRLSELAVVDILLDPSSAIFTTSNLTSLTLSFGYDGESQYTRSQLSQILQGQPNLQKLVLHGDALPPIEGSGTLAPIVLPRLVDLRLYGMGTFVAGFMVLVSMSPLHNVVIHIQSDRGPTFPVPSEAIKQILTAYYECQELEHPRKVDHLTVSMRHLLVVNASSSPTPACHPTYSLTLQAFEMGSAVVAGILSLFPLEHICVFAATELDLIEDDWHTVLQEMKGLMHLRFDSLEVGPVLDALGLDDEGVYGGC